MRIIILLAFAALAVAWPRAKPATNPMARQVTPGGQSVPGANPTHKAPLRRRALAPHQHRRGTSDCNSPQYDVCVLGGGASGASAAVFAKDKGLNVLVIEQAPQIGGHCNTIYVQPPAGAPAGSPDYLDIGAQIFPDTIAANIALDGTPNGRWPIDMVGIVRRFAGPDSVIFYDPTAPVTTAEFVVDTALGVAQGPLPASGAPPAAFFAALATLEQIVTVKYPWLDRYPAPPNGEAIAAELLGNFADFVVAYNLQPLSGPLFLSYLIEGGMGNWTELTTLYALRNVAPTVLRIALVPNASFFIAEGCRAMYNGIQQYLGHANIWLGATATSVTRPSIGPALIKGLRVDGSAFSVSCGKTVVAFEQTPQSLQFIDLDATESAVWQDSRVRQYYTGLLSAEGPVQAYTPQGWQILNLNVLNTSFPHPSLPGWLQMASVIPYFPVTLLAESEDSQPPLTDAEMLLLLQQQFASVPSSLVIATNITLLIRHNFYGFTSNAHVPIFFAQIAALQNYRNTFWVGAMTNFAAHHVLFSDSWDLVQKFF